VIGELKYTDLNGGEFAKITCNADAAPSSGDLPGRLVFSTTSDGASSPTERMRIQSDGSVVCTGNIFTGTSSALLTDTVFSRTQNNDDANSKIVLRPRNAAGGSSVQAEVTVSGLFKFNSGYGSAATAYGCRAWVNFNGKNTVSIREDGNVSSITDNGTGNYTVNFSSAMPDSNYAVVGSASEGSGSYKRIWTIYGTSPSTTSVRGQTGHSYVGSLENQDCEIVTVAVFR
jgi:uncharacterized protein (DUF2147 family)